MKIIGDPKTFLAQTALVSLGFYREEPDGDDGPLTKSAIAAAVAASKASDPSGKVAPFAERMMQAALTKVGLRETSKNHGPGIEELWAATSYPNGYANREPYCAAFVCWAMKEAAKDMKPKFSLLKSPVAYDVEKWAVANKRHGVEMLDPAKHAPRTGDIATLDAASHVLIVVDYVRGILHTVEGNTNPAGSREGDGFYTRTRSRNSLRKLIRLNA